MVCVHEIVPECISIFSSWLVHHMENMNIHRIKTNRGLIYIGRKILVRCVHRECIMHYC